MLKIKNFILLSICILLFMTPLASHNAYSLDENIKNNAKSIIMEVIKWNIQTLKNFSFL